MRGECICCKRAESCPETSVERLLNSYTCALFSAVEEPVYLARLHVLRTLGGVSAARAILNRPVAHRDEGEGEE